MKLVYHHRHIVDEMHLYYGELGIDVVGAVGSSYGAVLDMVADRGANAMLLVILGHLFPDWMVAWALFAVLDVVSHYAHMYASMATALHQGQGHVSHKAIDEDKPKVLQLYYHNKAILFTLVAGNEFLYVGAYLSYFVTAGTPMAAFVIASVWFGIIFGGMKQCVNVVQAWQAFKDIAAIDAATANTKSSDKLS